ncbi:membrane protein [Helicobacter pylori UM037]|uniref:Membrane protein n=1 Tax=Helicobacter pylori UM037 TaxID=1321939 RepID=A0AB33Z853_HELPX|nr:membrane protein [Helicobacter pylori UM037]KNE04963.1 membrane protein [Helicobacter pylori]
MSWIEIFYLLCSLNGAKSLLLYNFSLSIFGGFIGLYLF